MLDESYRYVDHINAREGKRCARVADFARHFNGPLRGDVEFIDLQPSHAPSGVRMILLGAISSRSHGEGSTSNPSNPYLRLQNRTWRRPIACEIDQWEVNHEGKGNSRTSKPPLSRVLLLGMLVQTGNAALEEILRKPFDGEGRVSIARTPVFEFISIHQRMPVDPQGSVGGVLPFLECVVAFLSREGGDFVDGHTPSGLRGFPVDSQTRLTEKAAVELHFVRLLSLTPRMPDRFRCHAEAWVYGEGMNMLNGVFKSAFLSNVENLSWGPDAEPAVFLVHPYDRIRVLLYEHATVGYGDVDLLRIPGFWQAEEGIIFEFNLPLVSGSPLFEGKIRLCLRRVPVKFVYSRIRKRWKRAMKRESAYHKAIQRREDQKHNQAFSLCPMM
ncbi:unnamed protein product [Phytomonas sp. EM1]|nr:unnamed protein product [Phytomonas sp. EM1]|eukprot:CCW65432.1 unnamed protein product [Phytomonas sp. isolate EM1]